MQIDTREIEALADALSERAQAYQLKGQHFKEQGGSGLVSAGEEFGKATASWEAATMIRRKLTEAFRRVLADAR